MTPPAVMLACDQPATIRAVAAAFEEEGVPLMIIPATGYREAATRSPLGIGIACVDGRIALGLSTGPDVPYLIDDDARMIGHYAARLAARRPLGLA